MLGRHEYVCGLASSGNKQLVAQTFLKKLVGKNLNGVYNSLEGQNTFGQVDGKY